MITLTGNVIRGQGYGRKLGFPTANIDRRQYVRDELNTRFGVYGGIAILPNGKKYKAGIVVGPEDQRHLPKLEAYLLGYKGNLYGQRLRLQLIKYVRPFRQYLDESTLRQQIASDMLKIKQLISLHE